MFKNRLFNIFITIVLVITIALTAREAFATASVVSGTSGAKTVECASLPSRLSIHTEVVKETGTRLTYSEDGPTGVDGGLLYLFSADRTCSR